MKLTQRCPKCRGTSLLHVINVAANEDGGTVAGSLLAGQARDPAAELLDGAAGREARAAARRIDLLLRLLHRRGHRLDHLPRQPAVADGGLGHPDAEQDVDAPLVVTVEQEELRPV